MSQQHGVCVCLRACVRSHVLLGVSQLAVRVGVGHALGLFTFGHLSLRTGAGRHTSLLTGRRDTLPHPPPPTAAPHPHTPPPAPTRAPIRLSLSLCHSL